MKVRALIFSTFFATTVFCQSNKITIENKTAELIEVTIMSSVIKDAGDALMNKVIKKQMIKIKSGHHHKIKIKHIESIDVRVKAKKQKSVHWHFNDVNAGELLQNITNSKEHASKISFLGRGNVYRAVFGFKIIEDKIW